MYLILTHDLILYHFGNNSPVDTVKKFGILFLGWLFIALGILGLFLPFLQGILFILIGLAILSSRSEIIRRFLKKLEKHFPHQHQYIEHWKVRLKNRFKRK